MSLPQRLFSSLTAVTGALLLLVAPAAQAGVQDFTVPNFEADYYLSRDAAHVSHLRVHEHLVASFPEIDQNHGILRAIPDEYQSHSLNLHIQSVTDDSGQAIPYTKTTSNHNLVLRIGDAGRYVHGLQPYNIDYTMDNVTAAEKSFDTFNWDTNGDQWQQQFGQVTARLHLPDDLSGTVQSSDTRCFTGPQGSTAQDCTITTGFGTAGDTVTTFTATRPLEAAETLTLNLSFASGTFAAYAVPAGEIWGFVALAMGLFILPILFTLIFIIRRWRKYGRDPKGRGTIIAEYLPPKDLSVLSSGVLLHEKFQPVSISALIIDLAVRHYFKIYEIKVKKLFNEYPAYEIELIRDLAGLRPEEETVVKALFGDTPATGQRVNLDTLKNQLSDEAKAVGESVTDKLAADGYFQVSPRQAGLPYLIWGGVLFAVGLIVMPFSLGILICGVIIMIMSQFMPARTQKGVDTRDYLLGLKLYMKMAEADRLKVLQSPHGELTEKIDTTDNKQLVKLYEKLLPYAILFGMERDWAKEFAALYDNPPDWYSSPGAFNAGYFAGSISGLSVQAGTSFTAPSSSASGGGFSGGGGGGGGGGGW